MQFTPGPHLSYIKRGGDITQIVKVRLLSDAELQAIEQSRDVLVAFANHSSLWTVVQLNAQDFRKYLMYVAQQHAKAGGMDERSMLTAVLNANRLLLNILTALRTFRDHSRTNAYRRYGRHSEFVKNWQAMTSKHELSSFAYRFLDNLRNYVQHCGMPLGNVQFHSEEDPSTKAVRFSAGFNFSRDDLLGNYNEWWDDVRPKLAALSERFPVLPYVNEVMEPIGRIALGTMELELPMVRPAIAALDALVGEIQEPEAMPCVVEFYETGAEPKLTMEHFPLTALSFAKQFISDVDGGRVPSSL